MGSAVRTKVLALLSLSLVQVFAGVVMKLASLVSCGTCAFSPQGSLLVSEDVKMSLSSTYLLRDAGASLPAARTGFASETAPRLVAHMAGLAAVYAWNNALAFWVFSRADPGAIMLTRATKNIYLYGIGAALNMCVFAYSSVADPSIPGLFEGYGWAATCVVLGHALIGITMNIAYKYADALVKTIATSLSVIVLLVLSAVLFGGRTDLMVLVGASVLVRRVAATYLYFALGILESKLTDANEAPGEKVKPVKVKVLRSGPDEV